MGESKKQPELVEEPAKELSVMEKAELAYALVNITKDEQFVQLLKSKPHGDLLLQVFIEAATDKINSLMGNKEGINPKDVNTITATTRDLDKVVTFFLKSPLVDVLATLVRNLPGVDMDDQPRSHVNTQPQRLEPAPDRSSSRERNSSLIIT